ncbi:MAG: metallophosphoesterase, partial [Planctomycetota bacterium]
MAKFVVTSDWHIGARMGTAGRAAGRFREIRFETAERVVELAGDEGAGALFLLGDTFDGDRVGAGDVERTLSILKQAPCPVFVLPGNHDWWHRGGVLASFARAAEGVDHVTVLTEPETPLKLAEIPGVTFFPCPLL